MDKNLLNKKYGKNAFLKGIIREGITFYEDFTSRWATDNT